jgi:GNAT superfamily N-acetyltransferase
MEAPEFLKLTHENIGDEHICCAFSDKKCAKGYQGKKEWLKNQFDEGFVFHKLNVRGKVFIEYAPAEKGWLPVDAPGYMLIHCFWVSGQYKDQGYGRQLLEHCLEASQGMNGVVVVTGKDKMPFMSDKKFFQKQGFRQADAAAPYFELWYKPIKEDAPIPRFKDIARNARCDIEQGLAVYYSPACPFNDYYVNVELKQVAEKRGIPLTIKPIDSREEAQNHFVPHTLYSVFYNGQFVTHHVLNEKYFLKYFRGLVRKLVNFF